VRLIVTNPEGVEVVICDVISVVLLDAADAMHCVYRTDTSGPVPLRGCTELRVCRP
jgi:hypothetical protein